MKLPSKVLFAFLFLCLTSRGAPAQSIKWKVLKSPSGGKILRLVVTLLEISYVLGCIRESVFPVMVKLRGNKSGPELYHS
jgi:hypothetical protein